MNISITEKVRMGGPVLTLGSLRRIEGFDLGSHSARLGGGETDNI